MNKIILNIPRMIVTVLLAGLVCMGAAQEEPSQYFVLEKGQRFDFNRKNLVVTDWSLARMDNKIKLGSLPSYYMNDTIQSGQTGFFQHFPMLIQPYTEYVLHYSVRGESMSGPSPYFQLNLLNKNRDYLQSHLIELVKADFTGEWVHNTSRFVTPGNVHGCQLYFYTTVKGTSRFWVDNIFLEQISAARSLAPAPVILFKSDSVVFDKSHPSVALGTFSLVSGKQDYSLQFFTETERFNGSCRLSVDWLALKNSKDAIKTEICEILPMRGIEPQWNGLDITWKEDWKKGKPGLILQRDRAFESAPGWVKIKTVHPLKPPAGASFVCVRAVLDKGWKGNLSLQDILLQAE